MATSSRLKPRLEASGWGWLLPGRNEDWWILTLTDGTVEWSSDVHPKSASGLTLCLEEGSRGLCWSDTGGTHNRANHLLQETHVPQHPQDSHRSLLTALGSISVSAGGIHALGC